MSSSRNNETNESYERIAGGILIQILDKNLILPYARFPELAFVISRMTKEKRIEFIAKYGENFVIYVCESPEWGTLAFDNI